MIKKDQKLEDFYINMAKHCCFLLNQKELSARTDKKFYSEKSEKWIDFFCLYTHSVHIMRKTASLIQIVCSHKIHNSDNVNQQT